MSPDDSSPKQRAPSAASDKAVAFLRWANEPFPAWDQLLTAHDVVRVTRRAQWALLRTVLVLGAFRESRASRPKDLPAAGWPAVGVPTHYRSHTSIRARAL
jgi:hypothetical protein